MNMFQKIAEKLFGKKEQQTAVPGATGALLAKMGIHELGPHRHSGIPLSVLGGCKKAVTIVPGTEKPAYTKEGKPVMAKDKHGRVYHATDQYGIPTKQWKQMQREQKRKAEGRWYSGAKVTD